MSALIEAKNVSFAYNRDMVLSDLQLTVKQGDFVVISGGNGSGKSTFLKILVGEIKAQGSLKVFGQDPTCSAIYKHIGYVPQNLTVNKITFPLTCLEMVSLNLYREMGLFKIPRSEHKARSIQLLAEMGLEEYTRTPFRELSGGLQQRVMICRALVHSPELLILDEPVAGIDCETKEHFLHLLKEENKKKVTIVLVTHEMGWLKEDSQITDRWMMKNGALNHV